MCPHGEKHPFPRILFPEHLGHLIQGLDLTVASRPMVKGGFDFPILTRPFSPPVVSYVTVLELERGRIERNERFCVEQVCLIVKRLEFSNFLRDFVVGLFFINKVTAVRLTERSCR